jgi:hypothetical protein
MYIFRKALLSDKDLLLGWINDPLSRKMSINKKKITSEEHTLWFSAILRDLQSSLYIYEEVSNQGIHKPLANIRLDKVNERNYLSWNVSGKMRNKGIGGRMLLDFVTKYKNNYFAKIKINNYSSMAICSKSGFHKYYTKEDISYWKNF